MKTNRKSLKAATDAELNLMLQNALCDLLTVMQPPAPVCVSAELYKDGVLVANAQQTVDAPAPFTRNDESCSKMYFNFLTGACVPGKGVH
jgi:hypothetical protein